MANWRQHFVRSTNQTITIILSAFAGGFAGNFLANNPGFFEQSGATIGLLVLLLPTMFLINFMLDNTNEGDNEKVKTVVVSPDQQDISVINENGDVVQTGLHTDSEAELDLPADKIREISEDGK